MIIAQIHIQIFFIFFFIFILLIMLAFSLVIFVLVAHLFLFFLLIFFLFQTPRFLSEICCSCCCCGFFKFANFSIILIPCIEEYRSVRIQHIPRRFILYRFKDFRRHDISLFTTTCSSHFVGAVFTAIFITQNVL